MGGVLDSSTDGVGGVHLKMIANASHTGTCALAGPTRNANRYWTMVASGAPDMKGSREQTVWFRFQQIECAEGTDYTNGKACKQVGQPQYWDTFWWTRFPGSGSGAAPPSPSSADHPTASGFYQSLLENRKWWDNELANEGMMQLSLPDVKTATNGACVRACVRACACRAVRACARAAVRSHRP